MKSLLNVLNGRSKMADDKVIEVENKSFKLLSLVYVEEKNIQAKIFTDT